MMSLQMTRQHILDEIRRTAKANGGVPLGRDRFEQETGIRYTEWYGKHWSRWGDAVREAGFAPNAFFRGAFDDDELLEKLIAFIRQIGRFPATGDLRIRKLNDPAFPNEKVLTSHFGSRSRLREVVIEYCQTHTGFNDVVPLCAPVASNGEAASPEKRPSAPESLGFVYLMKHGKHYKIGKTNATGRREYELAIQLPEKLRTVHVIKTDDPDGIEEYWHKRFAAKRGNGEWFALDAADLTVFKRRKFM